MHVHTLTHTTLAHTLACTHTHTHTHTQRTCMLKRNYEKMKCTKVPETLARIYANEHVCILISTCGIRRACHFSQMAENSLKF